MFTTDPLAPEWRQLLRVLCTGPDLPEERQLILVLLDALEGVELLAEQWSCRCVDLELFIRAMMTPGPAVPCPGLEHWLLTGEGSPYEEPPR